MAKFSRTIVLAADGDAYSAYPAGDAPPDAFLWGTVPATFGPYTEGTAQSIDFADYVAEDPGSVTYSIRDSDGDALTLSDGWSFATSTLSYSGTGVASFTGKIRATVGGNDYDTTEFTFSSVAAASYAWIDSSPSFQPILPKIAGYASGTSGGFGDLATEVSGGLSAATTVYNINNLNTSGAGSLDQFWEATGRRIGIITRSGVCQYAPNSLTRVGAGQACLIDLSPTPGFALRGCQLSIDNGKLDLFVCNLAIFCEVNDPAKAGGGYGGAMARLGLSTGDSVRLFFSNCALIWAVDTNFNWWYGNQYVGLHQCLIAEGLHNNIHPKGSHSAGILTPKEMTKFSIIRSLMAHNDSRNPLSRAAEFSLIDSSVYNWGGSGSHCGTDIQQQANTSGWPTNSNLINVLYIKGPDSGSVKPIRIAGSASGTPVHDTSKVYLEGIKCIGIDDTSQANYLFNQKGLTPEVARITSAFPTGYTDTPIIDREDYANLIASTLGPNPNARIPAIQRIVDTYLAAAAGAGTGLGQIIDTVTQSGVDPATVGYPTHAGSSIDYTATGDPIPGITSFTAGGVALENAGRTINASGYSALHEWVIRRLNERGICALY